MSTSTRYPAALAAALALFALAACSSSGPSSGASTGTAATKTSGASASSASPSAGNVAAGGGSMLHACALLSVSRASAAAGETFTSAKEQPFSTYGTVCTYAVASGPSMDVTVMNQIPGLDISTVKAEMAGAASQASPLVPVSGIGDQAWADALGTSASFGTHVVQIDGIEADLFGKHAHSEAVAKAVIAATG